MPLKFTDTHAAKVLEVQASGTLLHEDYQKLEAKIAELRRFRPKLRLLFEMVDFHGWDAAAFADDVKFDLKHAADIERIAMVGDKKWEKYVTMAGSLLTTSTVKYYDAPQIADARRWLEEGII